MSGPALVALTGPRSGTRLLLDQGELLVGRDADAGVVLSDPAVSRHHARLSREDGIWAVVDLDSLNGTFVNGVPVRRRALRSGDRIEIGSTVFVFQEEGVAPPSTAVELSDQALRLGSTLVVPACVAATEPGGPGRALSSERLAAANREIAGARSVPELARVVLDAAFDVTAARRGLRVGGFG